MRRGLYLSATLVLSGCATEATRPPTVAYTIRSAQADAQAMDRSLAAATLPVHLERAVLPNRGLPPVSYDTAENAIANAREAYTQGRFADCTRALIDATPAALVAAGKRDLAARVLLWTAACGFPKQGAAVEKDVQAFADWSLEIPKDAQAVNPDVERLLGRMKAKKKTEPTGILIASAEVPVRLEVDGEAARCTMPCTIELRYGQHVLSWSGDGVIRGFDLAAITTPRIEKVIAVRKASPEEAQEQWVSAYGTGQNIESASSLRLLSTALRARRLVLLDTQTSEQRIFGALVIDGDVVARADRPVAKGASANAAPDVLSDLLVQGRIVEPPPPLWSRPLFWIVVGVVAGGAATGAYFLAKPAEERTEVRF